MIAIGGTTTSRKARLEAWKVPPIMAMVMTVTIEGGERVPKKNPVWEYTSRLKVLYGNLWLM